MKKIKVAIVCFMLIFAMAGCSEKTTDTTGKTTEQNSITQDNTNVKDSKIEQTETATEEHKELTNEEIEAAEKVALDYYKNTVFTVNHMDCKEKDRAGFCSFKVNVSKGGVVQDPDRTIRLKLDKDGTWTVIGEGY